MSRFECIGDHSDFTLNSSKFSQQIFSNGRTGKKWKIFLSFSYLRNAETCRTQVESLPFSTEKIVFATLSSTHLFTNNELMNQWTMLIFVWLTNTKQSSNILNFVSLPNCVTTFLAKTLVGCVTFFLSSTTNKSITWAQNPEKKVRYEQI